MLHEMICGTSPWSEELQLRRILGLGQALAPTPMAQFRRHVPADLEALVARTLAWDATNRPTADELIGLLDVMRPHLDDAPADRMTDDHREEPAPTRLNSPRDTEREPKPVGFEPTFCLPVSSASDAKSE